MVVTNNEQPSKEGPEESSCDPKKHKRQPALLFGFFTRFLLYLSRKVMFLPMGIVLCIYLSFLTLLPMWPDFFKSYLAESDNIFNEYFIKPGWWWTMSVVFPLTLLTSYVYCCGHWLRILKHVSRLGVATSSRYICTSILEKIENNYGECIFSKGKNETKWDCLDKGYYWQGFAISVNTFTLIYSSLVLFIETSVLIDWEEINILFKEEDRNIERNTDVRMDRPMKKLTFDDFTRLKESYSQLSPFIYVLFLAATCLTLLWTSLLISTLIYFNTIMENLIGGVLAIFMWLFTYHWVYPVSWSVPLMPGDGLFKYQE